MRDLGTTPEAVGAALAEHHAAGRTVAPTLHEYPERPHVDDWSLRSALVRFAQPEPDRVRAVLDLVRRLESGMRPVAKLVEDQPRLSDLGRAALVWGDDVAAVLAAYGAELTAEERTAVDLLGVAAELDDLGAALAGWAVTGGADRPVGAVDACCRDVLRRLDALGVPVEEWYRLGPGGEPPQAPRSRG